MMGETDELELICIQLQSMKSFPAMLSQGENQRNVIFLRMM